MMVNNIIIFTKKDCRMKKRKKTRHKFLETKMEYIKDIYG